MKIEIDQSGKIENTEKDTVIAFSNGISKSILIKAKDKREIQVFFRKAEKSKIFTYKLFSVLIFILIRPYIEKITEIIIDIEYPGKSDLIKIFLLERIRKINPNFSARDISFKLVGKNSGAHIVAYGVFAKGKSPDKVVSLKEVSRNLL
jgi:hypothetical protein